MSANGTQQTMEKRDGVKDAKPLKPPIRPKPIVPPKPKQASICTDYEIKSPLFSPNSGGTCSPTFDIPSAFKISQLTGPQPYGTRRASLKRWSSAVGEEGPSSPVENVVPELYAKVTTQPLAAPVKPLQTGSVWKGKSPFVLTTRGWGEQKNQRKDIHESESFSQKHSFSSASKDADLKENEPVVEGNIVINSSSPTRSLTKADHGEVETDVQDLKQSLVSASEEEEKTSFGLTSSGKFKTLEMPAQDNEIRRSQESSSPLSVSPLIDLYCSTTKQATHYEHNKQDTKPENVDYKRGQETVGFPEDLDASTAQIKTMPLRTKDQEEPQLISFVPTAMPRTKPFVTENKENAKTVEENPTFDTTKPAAQEVYKYHGDRGNDLSEERRVIREEQDSDPSYLQTSQSQIVNQNTEERILGNLDQDEKHAISAGTKITDKPVTENEIYQNILHEDKESTGSMERSLPYASKNYDFDEGKISMSSDDHNKTYSDQEDKFDVPPTDMQTPVCTVRAYEIYSEGQQKNGTQIHGYNVEEDQDEFKNRQDGHDATVQTGEYVPLPTSDFFEKPTEYPSEYRSDFGNNAKFHYDSEIRSAPEMSEPADNETSANLYVGSQILHHDSLIPRHVYSHPIDESKEPSHSYMERYTEPGKPQEELSQLKSYESNRPELNYDELQYRNSETTAQDPDARVTQAEELSDHYKQSVRLEYYTAESPILNQPEVYLDQLENREDESSKPQYTQIQSREQEPRYVHLVELEDKQSDELVHTYGHSVEPDYKYQQLEKPLHKEEQSDKPSDMFEQLKEPVQRSELSKEPVYMYEQWQEPVRKSQLSEGSDLRYEETEELSPKHQKLDPSMQKYELLEETYDRCEKSEKTDHRNDQSEDSVHGYKEPDKPAVRNEQSEHLVQSYQHPTSVDHQYPLSKEPVHGFEHSEETVQKYGHSEGPVTKYEPQEESEHRYADLEEKVHKCVQLEDPGHKYKHLDEPTDNYGQTEQSVQGHQKSEESIHKYAASEELVNKQSKEIIQSHDELQEQDHRYKQLDEPIQRYEPENQHGQIEHSEYIYTGSDAQNSECTQSGLTDVESLQQQNKPVKSEESGSTPQISPASCDLSKLSETDIKPSEYLKQHLSDSYMKEPNYSDTLTDEMHASEKTLEDKYPLSGHQVLSVQKEETPQYHAKSEETQHVDGLIEGSEEESPAVTTIQLGESIPEEAHDQDSKITSQILNGHGELPRVDYTSDVVEGKQAEEPEETQAEALSEENFDFLEGTAVLDTSFMRGRASLGKKRVHRTPAGTCASEEDPEYWMFRDSTEPKKISESHSDEEAKDETSSDVTPDNSPSSVKSPNKKGIFAGIISPNILKGRLKTRSKTIEGEVVREEQEVKSPGKEKPESPSHSLNWLSALKKKKKSIKEDKKKQPK